MMQTNPRKVQSSSSRAMIAGPIRMRSVERGLRFSFEEEMVDQQTPDNQARKCVTRASKVMNDIAATIASQLSNAKESEIELELNVREMTESLIKDEELWKEFLKHLADSKVVTHLGVNELLKTFVIENRNRIESRYEGADVVENSEKPHSLMKRTLSMTGLTALVPSGQTGVQRRASDSRMVASSVKKTVHRQSSVSFQITPSLSDQREDPSDKLRCTSEPPSRHSISFDSDHWDAMRYRRMSLDIDTYRHSLSCGTNILQDSSDHWTESIDENSSPDNVENNLKPSSSMRNSKYSENTSRIGLFKRLTSSINPATRKGCNVEENNVGTKKNLTQILRIDRIWNREAQTKKRCNFIVRAKTSSSNDVPMSAKASMNTAISSPIMSGVTAVTPSLKKRQQHEANDSVRIQLKGVSSSHLETRHSFSYTKHINVRDNDADVQVQNLNIKSTTDGTPFVTNKDNSNKGSVGSTSAIIKQESTSQTLMEEQERLNPDYFKVSSTTFVEGSKENKASFVMQHELKSPGAPTELHTVYF